MCERCVLLHMQPAEGREYSVTLADCPGVFVDPCSSMDPYPGQLWTEMAAYIDSLDAETERLPSGCYACAQVLASRGLRFLEGLWVRSAT